MSGPNTEHPAPLSTDERRRLELAEVVCYLFGMAGDGLQRTVSEKALEQAWQDWHNRYRHEATPVTDQQIRELAERYELRMNRALAHTRGDAP